jgi:hypothetical protein
MFVFVIFAPVVGSGIFVSLKTLSDFDRISSSADHVVGAIFFITFFTMMFAYYYGLVPATAGGILTAIIQWKTGRVPWYAAVGIGLFVGVGFSFFQRETFGSDSISHIENVLVCTVTNLICWAVVRHFGQNAELGSLPNNTEAK